MKTKQNELYHFGVLGMRWGHHKVIKNINKIKKYNDRYDKHSNKLDKIENNIVLNKITPKLYTNHLERRKNKNAYKISKVYTRIEKKYGNDLVKKLSVNKINVGEKYVGYINGLDLSKKVTERTGL